MNKIEACYLHATIALCDLIQEKGFVTVNFEEAGKEYILGINRAGVWENCIRTTSIREVFEFVMEITKKEGI